MSSRRNKLIYIIVLTKSDVFKWLTLQRMQTHPCTFHLSRDAMLFGWKIQWQLFSFQYSPCHKDGQVRIVSQPISLMQIAAENQRPFWKTCLLSELRQGSKGALSARDVLLEKVTAPVTKSRPIASVPHWPCQTGHHGPVGTASHRSLLV